MSQCWPTYLHGSCCSVWTGPALLKCTFHVNLIFKLRAIRKGLCPGPRNRHGVELSLCRGYGPGSPPFVPWPPWCKLTPVQSLTQVGRTSFSGRDHRILKEVSHRMCAQLTQVSPLYSLLLTNNLFMNLRVFPLMGQNDKLPEL